MILRTYVYVRHRNAAPKNWKHIYIYIDRKRSNRHESVGVPPVQNGPARLIHADTTGSFVELLCECAEKRRSSSNASDMFGQSVLRVLRAQHDWKHVGIGGNRNGCKSVAVGVIEGIVRRKVLCGLASQSQAM